MDIPLKRVLRIELFMSIILFVFFGIVDVYPQVIRIVHIKKDIEITRSVAKAYIAQGQDRRKTMIENEHAHLTKKQALLTEVTEEVALKMSQNTNAALVNLAIEDLASQAGVELASVRHLDIIDKGDYTLLPIEMTFQAEFKDIVSFIEKLDNHASVNYVQTAQILKDEKTYPKLSMKLVVAVMSGTLKEGEQ